MGGAVFIMEDKWDALHVLQKFHDDRQKIQLCKQCGQLLPYRKREEDGEIEVLPHTQAECTVYQVMST